ncbi:uncharacterized protein BKCO1_7800025 [Diplodia corticola]|uniref:Lysine-specific metallo-endopeptidase domain-containing protein n=1 Tax=Diplodia corticola TaxID=236234 RepID=A0A1J9RNQ3_9PEZI|nr:uncharacterized protein BKCO1_7800025 [Diplodia corticola]OJD29556.1 hypothetical protein BKCO1_7800025 [Diplodia corticola]
MNFLLFLSVLPLSFAWPAPPYSNQSSFATDLTAGGLSEFAKRAAAPVLYPWPGKLKKGGCDEHIDDINQAYDQALEIAAAGSTALDLLKSARPKAGNDASADEQNKALKWDKYQQSLKDLFNIEVDSKTEPDDAMKAKITNVQDKLKAIADKKGSQGAARDADKPKLFCGEKGIDTLEAGKKLRDSDKKEKPAGKYGAWVFPFHNAKDADGKKDDAHHIPSTKINKKKAQKDLDHPCDEGGDNALALTMMDANAIFICDGGMKKLQTKLATPEEGKTMRKSMEKTRSLADTLLHEMLHLFQDLEDVDKVKFADKKDDEPEWEDKDNKVPKRDDAAVYGYLASYQLAKYVSADALKTVETYVWFAISAYEEDWKFEGKDGEAKKMSYKK